MGPWVPSPSELWCCPLRRRAGQCLPLLVHSSRALVQYVLYVEDSVVHLLFFLELLMQMRPVESPCQLSAVPWER
jgi:hypothetical protein